MPDIWIPFSRSSKYNHNSGLRLEGNVLFLSLLNCISSLQLASLPPPYAIQPLSTSSTLSLTQTLKGFYSNISTLSICTLCGSLLLVQQKPESPSHLQRLYYSNSLSFQTSSFGCQDLADNSPTMSLCSEISFHVSFGCILPSTAFFTDFQSHRLLPVPFLDTVQISRLSASTILYLHPACLCVLSPEYPC